VPAKGRTPGNPPRRRPRVAGLSRRGHPDTPPDDAVAPTVTEQWADDLPLSADPAPADPAPAEPAPAEPPQPESAAEGKAVISPAPTVTSVAPAAPNVTSGASATGVGRFAGVLMIVLLLLVTVVFGAAALVFRGQAARASTGSADNRAVVDNAATTEVVGQVSKAVETVLSYDYTKLDDNERAAGEVITGKYRDEFAKTFADVRKTAPEQKIVLTTTVLLAGVAVLNGDRAEVIATMDLAAVRDTTPYNSPGRVKVIANKVDGRWKIAEMTLL